MQLPLRAPLSGEPAQRIARVLGQIPHGRHRLLHPEGLLAEVLHPRPARYDSRRVDAVEQTHRQRLRHVLQHDLQQLSIDVSAVELEDQRAVAVRRIDFQGRLSEQPRARRGYSNGVVAIGGSKLARSGFMRAAGSAASASSFGPQ